MKQSQQPKTSFMVRTNSQSKQHTHRINSLQKQFNQTSENKRKTDSVEGKEESSAVMELLQITDEHIQWKDKNSLQKPLKSKNNKRSMNDLTHNNDPSMILDSPLRLNEDFREQQYLNKHSPFLDNIYTKKNSKQEQNSKNPEFKKSQELLKYENYKMLRESSNNQSFLMNRTHYRNKYPYSKSSQEKNHDFSLTQRTGNRFLPNQTFYEKHLGDNLRANSNFEFYRNKSPLDKKDFDEQENKKKGAESGVIEHSKSIKIQANKSITVRQMLQKINSHEDISLIEPTAENKKLRSLLQSHTNRQPFDPYTKKTPRQHQKKFTPFKIEEERKLEYSLQKLEQHIRRNPEIDNKWDQIQIRYLEKPTYCSWVERNKEKIKRKKHYPLTVRPLKLLN